MNEVINKKFINIEKELYDSNLQINKYYLFPAHGYRMRCEFAYKNDSYIMFDEGNKIELENFNKAHPCIQNTMVALLGYLKTNKDLTIGLFQINFRTNGNETLVSLIYRKTIPDNFLKLIKKLESTSPIRCLARSKNKIITNFNNHIISEVLCLNKIYKLQHSDNSFYQPNYYALSKMIEFIGNHLENCEDLLELYCGCGSFTIPLATKFHRIFASDNNRDNIYNLKINLEMNKVSNVSFARISDDELSQAMGGRVFNRMRDIEINLFKFSHVLVDPPRMGLHKDLIERLVQFKNIIYVSCNPNTFLRDLNCLEGYKVKSLAVFDQFSNTEHLELIGILSR